MTQAGLRESLKTLPKEAADGRKSCEGLVDRINHQRKGALWEAAEEDQEKKCRWDQSRKRRFFKNRKQKA